MRFVESRFITSATKPSQYPASAFVDFAFVGKSNVGKSSMINTLLQRKMIAKVSRTPGKTRLINFFEVRFKEDITEETGFLNVVDLPGYGYAKVSKTERDAWRTMLSRYFETRENLGGVVVLVDIRHKADTKDLMLLELVQQFSIPYLVVATKSDKIGKSKIPSYIKHLSDGLSLPADHILPFSALHKSGVEKVMNWFYQQLLTAGNPS